VNHLTSLHSLVGLTQLHDLSAKDNQLRCIGPELGTLPRLRKLHLDSNRIESMEGLEACTGLHTLGMTNNLLTGLGSSLAGCSGRLEVLHVSANRLSSLDGLEVCTRLRVLDASRNQLRELPSTLAAYHLLQVRTPADSESGLLIQHQEGQPDWTLAKTIVFQRQ